MNRLKITCSSQGPLYPIPFTPYLGHMTWADAQTDAQTDAWMCGCADECTVRRMDAWMCGWVHGCMDAHARMHEHRLTTARA